MRRTFDRSEWTAKYLYRSYQDNDDHGINRPGVLMLQIDGLAYEILARAMAEKKVPFLTRLVHRDHYLFSPIYSGLPSTTPAVQAELFYGVKSAIPAFGYYDRKTHQKKEMLDPEVVDELARDLAAKNRGLLRDGISYSNIFAGDADEAPFCMQSMLLKSVYKGVKLKKFFWFYIVNLDKTLRILALSLLETALAFIDFCKGLLRGKNLFKEFKFIVSRIGVCVVLREIIRLRVKIDIARGLPIIHANFVGYDEHAHRRGPSSTFALRTLKGIDRVIRELVNRAVQSECRDYQIVIYSDHGQENSVPYQQVRGETLHAAVARVFAKGALRGIEIAGSSTVIDQLNPYKRNTKLMWGKKKRALPEPDDISTADKIHIAALGPLGHIYLPKRIGPEEMRSYAGQLVNEAAVPLVFHIHQDQVVCTSTSGTGEIFAQADQIFGAEHPFLDEVTKDMDTLCHHPQAGDFIISGWFHRGRPLTFPLENGSHGGPGSKETRGFAIFPESLSQNRPTTLRPSKLRRMVAGILDAKAVPAPSFEHADTTAGTLRVMSYNIHSCIGADGKLFPERIARIIRHQNPSLIGLQEVDRGQQRSKKVDQIRLLAKNLGMSEVFFPLARFDGGDYGLAVLSRFPIIEADCISLPSLSSHAAAEKRGIMHIICATDQGKLHFFNTHLSLTRRERLAQMAHVVGAGPLSSIPTNEPIIFCGDLNGGVNSPVYKLLSNKLKDAQLTYSEGQPAPTFMTVWPLLRLDHIFHSNHLVPLSVKVLSDWECRLASDHFPVLAEFQWVSQQPSRPGS